MKKQERKNDNRGFSLVELIVVVAIMAVLIGVLAPQYLKYVEKTRVQKDKSALEEIRHAVEITIADEEIYNDLGFSDDSNTVTVEVPDGNNTAFSCTVTPAGTGKLAAELEKTFDKVDFTSKDYNNKKAEITITNNAGTIKVDATFN